MRLIEARNKMHHGTFNSEGQFVDKDGNPIELKTSSFDPSDLDTIKDILDKAREWANEHGVNPPPSFDPFNMDGNGDASGESSSSSSNSSENSSDDSSNNNNSSNSQDGSQGNSQGQSSDSGDPSGAGGDEGDASDSGNNDSQNQSQGNSGDSSNNSNDSSEGNEENEDEQEKIPPDPKKTYVDIRNNKHYKWDGTKFVEVPA